MKTTSFTPLLMTGFTVLLCSWGTAHAQRVYLAVDRATGDLTAVSSADIQVDGYSITSPSGNLIPENWNSLNKQGSTDWTEANPRITQLSELNLPGSETLAVLQPVSLGNAYNGAGIVPDAEDVQFGYTTPAGVLGVGSVQYLGPPQLPGIAVDRSTGAIEVGNPLGFELTGYSIISGSGALDPTGFNGLEDNSVEGWREANLTAQRLSELNLQNSTMVDVNSAFSVGNAYTPGGAEDLVFEYLTVDGELANGLVSYLGSANDLTLQVDLLSGSAAIVNPSALAGEFDITGYTILSASGSLSVENWNSFADSGAAGAGWTEANPAANALSELNPQNSTLFDGGKSISLGNILAGVNEDLVFHYATVDGTAAGTVEYLFSLGGGPLTCAQVAASRMFPGDLNGDNSVGFDDFLVLSANFGQAVAGYEQGDVDCGGDVAFADFLALSANFGQSAAATATVSTSSVPEPSSCLLVGWVLLGLLSFRRRR